MNRFLPYALVGFVLLITVGGVLRLAAGGTDVSTEPTPPTRIDAGGPLTVPDTRLDEQLATWLAAAPLEGSDAAPPTPDVLAAAAATYRALTDGDVGAATQAATEFGYRLEPIEQGTALIASDAEATPYGVYVRTAAGRPILVEVPHPFSDRRTLEVGAWLSAAVGARDLMVAGAHRRAGRGLDVAHDEGSVFDAWHRQALPYTDVVVQVHGFHPENHPSIPADVVLSSGGPDGSAHVDAVAASLRTHGFDVCVYDGSACAGLAGTTNLQARSAREAGVPFVHVEIALPVRIDDARLLDLVGALAAGLL